MSPARAGLVLWAAGLLLIPLPYFIVAEGHVPVVRMAMIGAISTIYAAFVDGSGVAWPITAMLIAHVAAYAVVLAAAAALLVRVIPDRMRQPVVVSVAVIGLLIAVGLDIYRTPFDDVNATSSWLGLFQ